MDQQQRKGVVQIDATATRDVENDVLELTFTVTKDGKESGEVQEYLKEKVKAALAVITPHKKPGEVEVETTGLAIQPRYGKKSELIGYWGSATLVVRGTDTSTISKIGGEVVSMPIANVSQAVSRKLRESMEAALIEEAIRNFNAKATQISTLFGYTGYDIETVHVSVNEGGGYRPKGGRAMMLSAAAAMPESVQTEVGKSALMGTVQGSILLTRAQALPA